MRSKYSLLCTIIISFVTVNGYANSGPDGPLNAMNRNQSVLYKDTVNRTKGKLFKILVVGNSLSWHAPSPGIGWNLSCGMAATSVEKDYAHIVWKKMCEVMPGKQVRLRIANLAKFERNFLTYDFQELNNLVDFKPDIIIIQLGENVKFDDRMTPELFKEKYISLTRYLRKEKSKTPVICTTPFFPDKDKNRIIAESAASAGSFIVDLSHLILLDKENYAKDESQYPTDRSIWKNAGIGIHPGNTGMKNIAEQIFITINALFLK